MNKRLSVILILAILAGVGLSLASKSLARTDVVSIYYCGPGTEQAKGISFERNRPIKGYPVAYDYSKLSANTCIEKGKSYPMGFSLINFVINSAILTGIAFLVLMVISKIVSPGKKSSKNTTNKKIARRKSR